MYLFGRSIELIHRAARGETKEVVERVKNRNGAYYCNFFFPSWFVWCLSCEDIPRKISLFFLLLFFRLFLLWIQFFSVCVSPTFDSSMASFFFFYKLFLLLILILFFALLSMRRLQLASCYIDQPPVLFWDSQTARPLLYPSLFCSFLFIPPLPRSSSFLSLVTTHPACLWTRDVVSKRTWRSRARAYRTILNF